MMAHVVLPHLLLRTPEHGQALMGDDGSAWLTDCWASYAERWGLCSTAEPWTVERWWSDGGMRVIAVPMPCPQIVPEAHLVLWVVAPWRACYVVEHGDPFTVRQHRPVAWLRVGHEPVAEGDVGFLAEWMADGGRKNLGIAPTTMPSVLPVLAAAEGWPGGWHRAGAPWTDVLADVPVRPGPPPLDPIVHLQFEARMKALLADADADPRGAAVRMRATLNQAVEAYGTEYTELTHWAGTVTRLFLDAGDGRTAAIVAAAWRALCHRYRGSRSPELYEAYTVEAACHRVDPDIPPGEREERARLRLAARDTITRA